MKGRGRHVSGDLSWQAEGTGWNEMGMLVGVRHVIRLMLIVVMVSVDGKGRERREV